MNNIFIYIEKKRKEKKDKRDYINKNNQFFYYYKKENATNNQIVCIWKPKTNLFSLNPLNYNQHN